MSRFSNLIFILAVTVLLGCSKQQEQDNVALLHKADVMFLEGSFESATDRQRELAKSAANALRHGRLQAAGDDLIELVKDSDLTPEQHTTVRIILSRIEETLESQAAQTNSTTEAKP